MKSLFIEVKYVGDMRFTQELIEKLPDRVTICSNIQYLDFLPQLKDFLEQNGKTVFLFKSRHGQYPGQVLGCDVSVFDPGEPFDGFLYLGDGLFHPTALLFNNKKPVYMYSPRGESVEVLDVNYLDSMNKKKMARLSKFIMAKTVGVLVTRKPGQNQSRAVAHFRKEMEGKGKDIFVFLADNVNLGGLENFNFIDSWVNTACPRIVQDFNCVNLRDLEEINFFSGKDGVF